MEKLDCDNYTLRLYNNLTGEYDYVLVKYNKETNMYNIYYSNLIERKYITAEEFLEKYYPFLPGKLNSVYGEFIASEMIKKNREEKIKSLLD